MFFRRPFRVNEVLQMVTRFSSVVAWVLPLILCQVGQCDFWVNELNYESSPNVEIVVSPSSSAVSLSTVTWSLYDGSTGSVYASHLLSSFTFGSTLNGYSIFRLTGFTIQNGGPSGGPNIPDGWAISVGGSVVEFKSYEGSFTATSGVAAGLTSTDIGVRQEQGTPSESSMQLQGTGTVASQFTWIAGQGPSYGQQNLGQTLQAVPEPSSVAFAGLALCAILIRRKWKS